MKFLISLYFILISTGSLFSQSTVAGYYVSQTSDTFRVQIKIPKSISGQAGLSELIDKVVVIDSVNGEKKFNPGDIKSFGFLYHGIKYDLYSKPIHKNGLNKFLPPIIIGSKTSLYQYSITSIGGYGSMLYIFEKADGSYAFLHLTATLNKFRETLQEFYKDNLDVKQFFDTKFQNRGSIQNDIKEILQAVNNS